MNIDIVRAWKDAEYRESLSSEELALAPAHPAGEVELAEEDLLSISGGYRDSVNIVYRSSSKGCDYTAFGEDLSCYHSNAGLPLEWGGSLITLLQ